MGDKQTLAKARQELEELYSGIPDDSVNLSFKDFASFQQKDIVERKKSAMTPIKEEPNENLKGKGEIDQSPSLDFSKGLEGTRERHQCIEDVLNYRILTKNCMKKQRPLMVVAAKSPNSEDMSGFNMVSPMEERGGRRRPGIPHSNICALCSRYVYVFRHRCLVCGRVYCRVCVLNGMGDMSEGRKCIDCLGRRYSERYIHKAGQTGCCCWKYPNNVEQQELRWAEKGPRRTGEEKRAGQSRMMSRAATPGTPSMSYVARPRSSSPLRSPANYGNSHVMSPKMPTSPCVFPL